MNAALVSADEVDVWLAFYEDITDGTLLANYRRILSAEERGRETRFLCERDRRRYLVTRALLRTVLSRYIPLEPNEWLFAANGYGRPHVANVQARDAALSFNISHTRSLIVLAVGTRRGLGVDVENITVRQAPIEIAHHYLAPQEVSDLAAIPPRQQQHRFFEYWTLKEAYMKARGMGLSLPLDKFWFQYPADNTIEFSISPELADDAGGWQFWQFQPTPEYLVAICVERSGDQLPHLTVRQITPMKSEQTCAFTCSRASTHRR